MKNKKCPKCKKFKNLSKFSICRKRKDSLECWCKDCRKIYYNQNSKIILRQIKNNHKKYPWKQVLKNINQRCNNNKFLQYKDYGGRGIKCIITNEELKQLWFRDEAYLMKQPSIDRKDNNGHYTFKNCRFIERGENSARANRVNKCKEVCQFDLNNKFIKKWNSIISASYETNIIKSSIAKCTRGEQKTAGGFIWKYNNRKN